MLGAKVSLGASLYKIFARAKPGSDAKISLGSRKGYGALRKIGAVKTMINKSIFSQVCIFFMLPLSLAIVHSIVGVRVVNSYLMALGSSNQINSILLTALIIVIVYGGYLYGTYISYKNIIDNEFS